MDIISKRNSILKISLVEGQFEKFCTETRGFNPCFLPLVYSQKIVPVRST